LNIFNLQSVIICINGLPHFATIGIIRNNDCRTLFAGKQNNLKRTGLNQGKLLKISTTNDTGSRILGCWILGTGHWVLGIGYRIFATGYLMLNFGPLTLNVDKLVKRQIFDFYSFQHIEIKSLKKNALLVPFCGHIKVGK